MTVLITGVTGFIGHYLAQYLLDKNFRVIGASRSASRINHPLYDHFNTDFSKAGFTAALPDRADTVVHLAQSKQYRHFPEGAADMFGINIRSTFELLEWARGADVSRFFYASTGNIYKPQMHPFTEETPCQPSSFYGASKLAAEQLILPYQKFFQIVIGRIFGVYGPLQEGMLIANLIQSVLSSQPVQLAGGAGLYFTPLFIEDCAIIIYNLITAEDASMVPAVLNIAGDQATTIAEVVAHIEDFLNTEAYTNATDGTPGYLLADTRRLKRALPHITFTPLSDGLAKTVAAAICEK